MRWSGLLPSDGMLSGRRFGAWAYLSLAWLLVSIAAMMAAGEFARRGAEADLARQAKAGADLHAAVLRSELEKHRSLPLVLSEDLAVRQMLIRPAFGTADNVSLKLEVLSSQARAATIYVLDAEGVTRAASNWQQPTSFVGSDYSFRPYFNDAMRQGSAEFFALGTVSRRPGLFLSRRIGPASDPLGVVVVKVEFDSLEADWRASGEPAYVTDDRGLVLITSVPEWRFRPTRPLSDEERRSIQSDQTVNGQILAPLAIETPVGKDRVLVRASVDGPTELWISAQTQTDTPGWTLHLLSPVGSVINATVNSARAVAGLLVTLLVFVIGILLRRRQQARVRAAAEEAARADLEQRIDDRTAELRSANGQLSDEIEERRRAEASREVLREELVQANKLATLGQIAAGVAHEINQPVAAIRLHAETAAAYSDRGDRAAVHRNLARVSDLTERIGTITDELRAFSRKSSQAILPVNPSVAIDGAMLLLGSGLRQNRIDVVRTGLTDVEVLAEPIRLEQVVVNLVQNAFEAMTDHGVENPQVVIDVSRRGPDIEISIRDNGPGVDTSVSAALFTPFVTTKTKGLGLGLVICRDIIAGFGGELNLRHEAPGAEFVISLKST